MKKIFPPQGHLWPAVPTQGGSALLHENKIRCFLSLAETRNFTMTASLLYLSQQAVSKNIHSLEEDLGMKLFTRTSRSVELTPAGQQCYELFASLSKQYSARMAAIRGSYEHNIHHLEVGLQYFLDFGDALEYAFTALRADSPKVQLETTRYSPSVLLERLRSHRLDMILIYRRFVSNESGLKSLHLAYSPRVLMVSPSHPLATPEATYHTFAREPLVSDSLRGESREAFDLRIQRDLDVLGLAPAQVICVSDRDTAYTYAETGLGVVIGTEMSRIAHSRRLVSYPTNAVENLLLVWNQRDENPGVEKYARLLAREYRA